MSLSLPFPRLRLLAAMLLLAVVLPAQPVERSYSPTDETAEGLIKYKTAMDAKNYAEAQAVLNGLMTKVPADSYDAALIHQYRLQIFLQTGEYAKAIEPMERSLQLSEAKTPTYFDERITRELYYYLVQLYFQEANQTKNTTLAASQMDKATKAMESWIKITPETNADAQLLYAQLLISRALLNPDKPDLALVKRSIEQIDIGLHLTTRPRDTFYVLKLVCLQQLDRNAEAAELLELLLKQKPDNANYWQQLAAIYLNIAQELRAVVTIERAQSHGFMNQPKDHFNLIGIYFNIGQYEKAAELLESALQSGRIENDPKNWELLALSYQQLQRPIKGIEALKQGAKAFPSSGQLEFLIAQSYTAIEKPAEAMTHIQAAISKGNLTRPYQAYLSLAYTAYSLQKYDVALDAARKATEYPEGAKDGAAMVKALEEVMKDREAKKNNT
ncbi:Anaphase-promoting complex, cyclosome, subunit 3 [Lacunisphaera limnophila]|uniref:Anaphase-promoting complex, cyclosome, subunit 3 n=1 Tax=Lacunisphaera limnophila TaxID=1838286 RepID=A0A1D8AZM6_9BACT|nr:tetratricopeptide repeat protein [Lacunisphaera limnophila]AOS46340.1 Anaphase-promoting complex, cyclosome, subunit 3 [Lacunisphaera limnophila]